jgi:hypothetical protein
VSEPTGTDSDERDGKPVLPDVTGDAQDREPVLPEVSGDERAEGWGDDPRAGLRDEQWYRRERPPHHE